MDQKVMNQARLESVLRARLPGFERLIACERLSAGASRETYRVSIAARGAPRTLALRRSAGGEASAMGEGPGLSTEAKLFEVALKAGVPGPDVVIQLAPEDGLGVGFLMDWIAGETLGARIARQDAFAEVRPVLARQCGQILARLHAVDVAASGLDAALQTLTPEQAVRQTLANHAALDTAQPMIDFTGAWLLAHLPAPRPPALTHGDFRNGNLMVTPEAGVVAVLDWELAHVGDPIRDLGWLCTRSWRFGVSDKPVGGFGEREDLFAGYEEISGESVDRDAVHFWEVFGSFWWAVGTLSMAQSFRNGSETSVERPAIGRRTSECQIDCVNMLIPGPALLPKQAARAEGGPLPAAGELLAGVSGFLREAGLDGRTGFLARVAANAVETVARELALGPSADALAGAGYAGVLGRGGMIAELRARMCAAIRAGEIDPDSPALHAALRQDVLGRALIDQPDYAGTVEAVGRIAEATG